ncbi:MAG: hypothetical protein M1833_001492 [Piccolia ochrophora]|nr:MAG: hypothetical protein M1833_001492 [Piccolia ochrophora]
MNDTKSTEPPPYASAQPQYPTQAATAQTTIAMLTTLEASFTHWLAQGLTLQDINTAVSTLTTKFSEHPPQGAPPVAAAGSSSSIAPTDVPSLLAYERGYRDGREALGAYKLLIGGDRQVPTKDARIKWFTTGIKFCEKWKDDPIYRRGYVDGSGGLYGHLMETSEETEGKGKKKWGLSK